MLNPKITFSALLNLLNTLKVSFTPYNVVGVCDAGTEQGSCTVHLSNMYGNNDCGYLIVLEMAQV